MGRIFLFAVIIAGVVGLFFGNADALADAVLLSGGQAVQLVVTLGGAYLLWCGVLKVMERSGLSARVASLFRPFIGWLFPEARGDTEAETGIAVNFAANLLGMGNAATPAGLKVIARLKALAGRCALPTDAMCMFLLINTSSLQLIPTTLISMRAAAGSQAPGDILLPTLLSTLATTLVSVLLGLCMRRINGRKRRKA